MTAINLATHPLAALRPMAMAKSVILEPLAPGIESLRGRVASHRQRKQLHHEISCRRPNKVVNDLGVSSRNAVRPRRLLGQLKRDAYLAGVPFSLGESPPYRGLYHVTMDVDTDATITLDGRVPDSTYRSYLETRLWTAPGVERVVNRTTAVTPDADQPDVDSVVARLLEINPTLPDDITEQISVAFEDEVVALAGTVDDPGHLKEIERDAWAVPQVAAVRTTIEVQDRS